uniref:C-type lectin domain-containing protein n=1 Tax=Plectus sambesii TaxID=2011161 RepID=A0A914WYQ0_9BILA
MTISILSKGFILCFLLSPFGFHGSILASAQTIPNMDKFDHRGFGYFTNSKYILLQATTNLDMCVYMCHVRPACYSLSYRSTTSTCQLNAAPVSSIFFVNALTVDSQYKLLVRQMEQQETCPDSSWIYLSSSKKCYRSFNTTLKFDSAEIECNKFGYGGHIVQPSTNEEVTLIGGMNNQGYYLGIIWLDTPTSGYYFVDGRPVVWPTNIRWPGGSSTFPGRTDGNVIATMNGYNPVWYQYYSGGGGPYPYICELPVLHG